MAYNFVNGYSYPTILIKNATTNAVVERIDLDLCMSNGMEESYVEDFKRNQLEKLGRFVDFDFKACRITWTLDYSEYVKKNNLLKIEKILAYHSQPDSYKIYLRPRTDIQRREFEVRFLDGNYSIGILKGGAYAKGNKSTVIKFVSTELISKNFIDPDDVSIPRRYI